MLSSFKGLHMALPNGTTVNISSVFMRLLFSGSLVLCFVCAATAETSPGAIIAAWRAREATVTSARIEWTESRLDKMGSISGPDTSPAFPAEDTEYKNTYLLELDGTSIRLERHGYMWLSTSSDLTSGRLRKLSELAVYSNGIHTDLSSAEGDHQGAIIHKPVDNQDVLHMFRVLPCWPTVWYVRPFLFPEKVLPFGGQSELTILSESASNVIVSGRNGAEERVTIDPAQRYLVTHATGPNTELQITYEDDSSHGSIPKQWTVVETSSSGELLRSQSCEITRFELNVPVPADRFSLTFPVGTKVLDENDNVMEVDTAGKLVPAVLITRQSNDSRLIWLVVTLVILVILVGVYMRSKKLAG